IFLKQRMRTRAESSGGRVSVWFRQHRKTVPDSHEENVAVRPGIEKRMQFEREAAMITHISLIFADAMKQKVAFAIPIVALVPAFFPIYLHFSGSPEDEGAQAAVVQPVETGTISPGFNCDYASTATELTICQSNLLAELDRTLNARYDTLVFDMEGDRLEKLENAQATWRRSRDKCRAEIPCIEAAYVVRIETLSALITALR
ncbi:MAG: lysozyme inhibitor LprI family protein, partial [Pseudomonadota bacterium]